MLRYNGGGGGSCYLKDDRTMKTDDVADQWQKEMDNIANCTIDVSASTPMLHGEDSAA